MGSLLELLKDVNNIPDSELRMGVRESERPTEMAILGKIIPNNKILEIRKEKGYCISRGYYPGTRKIIFQVTNGITHTVATFLEQGEVKVVDNRDTLTIDTVEGLREHILKLAGVE